MIDLLDRLRGVKPSGSGYSAKCPAHKDETASLSVHHRGGKWLLRCHADCSFQSILDALGLQASDLFDDQPQPWYPDGDGSGSRHSVDGLTLAAYAAAKNLPVDFLRSVGLEDVQYNGRPAVGISYRDATGKEIAVRYRIALNGDRFRWKPGSKAILYGQERLEIARAAGEITVVEGESDAQTLWHHDVPAIAVPGASSWNERRDAPLLDDIATIYIVIEPDRGGETVRGWVSRSKIRDRVKLVFLPVKDPSALHLDIPHQFAPRWETACRGALPWSADVADETTADEVLLAELARLKPFDYDRRRESAAEQLGVSLKTLDAEMKRRRKAGDSNLAGRPASFLKIEPSAGPVDGAEVLTLVSRAIRHHVVVSEVQADAVALWVFHAHCIDAADHTPFLALLSPEPGSGKSTLLKVLRRLTPKARLSTSITSANLFRFIDKYSPTLLVDEADAFVPEKEELRGILDGGHDRETAWVSRLVGDGHEDREFFTFCARAISMMGKRPHPTLVGRSIVIEMVRYAPGERPARIDGPAKDHLADLAGKVAGWTIDNIAMLSDADPAVPDFRDGDNWRPLFAIADLAGGGWSERSRTIAVALSGGDSGQDSVRVELLRDIRALFGDRDVDRLTSKAIVEALVAKEDRRWPEWKNGKPLSTNQLAGLLRPHKIRPGTIRLSAPPAYDREVDRQTTNNGKETASGYLRDDFAEAWKRYLNSPHPPSQTLTSSQPETSAVSEPFELSHEKIDVRVQIGRKAAETLNSEGVRAQAPLTGDKSCSSRSAGGEPSAAEEGASETDAAKAKALESILKRFRRLALDIRESPEAGANGVGGWPDDINRLADRIADFAEKHRDPDSIHAIVNAVLITPKLGIGGERGTAAHRYLWDRAHHVADAEDKRRLFQARPDFG